MLKPYAHYFYRLGNLMNGLWNACPHQPIIDTQLPAETKAAIIQNLTILSPYCQELGLNNSAAQVRKILNRHEKDYTPNKIRPLLERLHESLYEELSAVQFKHIPTGYVRLCDNPELFGSAVANNFPSAVFDIQEAGNCFALGRPTAGVMHLMRALEVALDAIGRGIGLANVVIEAKNSWGTALRHMREQTEKNNKTKDPAWVAKSAFFEEAQTYLASVKNAWRNPSMHLERKYVDKEAARIYRAVKDFMEHLAEHLDESGQYTP
jgi:hypothetical protein